MWAKKIRAKQAIIRTVHHKHIEPCGPSMQKILKKGPSGQVIMNTLEGPCGPIKVSHVGKEDKGQAGHYKNITSQTYRAMRAIYAEIKLKAMQANIKSNLLASQNIYTSYLSV